MKLAEQTYTCNRCNEQRPGARFPKKGWVCKDCNALRAKQKYHSDPEYRRKAIDKTKEHNAKHRGVALRRSREHYKNNRGRYLELFRKRIEDGRSVEDVAKWREKHPLKASAHQKVRHAIKTGKLIKEPCKICGKEPAEAHHQDYTKPLEVMWMCKAHHEAWHRCFLTDDAEE